MHHRHISRRCGHGDGLHRPSTPADWVPGHRVRNSDSRLHREVAFLAERSDITEETTRLRSHLDQFAGLKDLQDETGKRMDFILQEMNREATTILSKTSGLNERGGAIGQAAIEIKVEIEKLREQVQNIE